MPRDDAQLTADPRVAPSRVIRTRDEWSSSSDERDLDSPLGFPPEEEPKFLRAQKRVPVRRGALQKKTASRIKDACIVLCALGLAAGLYVWLGHYGNSSWRFRLESSDNIVVQGLQKVSRAQVMDILGADIGRNIFFVPLSERKRQLEEIPWVESATVMRLLPDRLAIDIQERTPVAFVRIGPRVGLIDEHGVIMEMPRNARYSFPVIHGMSEAEPVTTRALRMKVYSRLLRELDSEGAQYSKDLSEVDLSDPEDVRITTEDPAGAVLIHLGKEQFLERYKIYIAHVQQWRQQFHKLESVDLRYERQIIVNPDPSPGAAGKPAPEAR